MTDKQKYEEKPRDLKNKFRRSNKSYKIERRRSRLGGKGKEEGGGRVRRKFQRGRKIDS